MSDFIHLHNHTHYSLQDGACTVDGLINAAKRNNMKAVALTDHGVMYGISEFYRKAKKEGIKPIIGMEAYIVKEGSRFDRGKEDVLNKKRIKTYNHLLLLAKNNEGYKNLSKLSTLGHTEGFYYRPRIDLELLKKHKDGLICSTACAGGIIATHLINNDYEKAKHTAKIFKEIFEDDFYLEIQDHGMDIEKAVLDGMPKLSKELNIKLVATNDCHYIEPEHAIPHNILLLLSDKNGADFNQLRYGTDQIYFKSADAMIKLFKKYKGAVENTLEIESKTNVELDFNDYHFPQFPIPKDSKVESLDDYFELLAREGLKKKFNNPTDEIIQRFEFEIDTIKKMGFAGYFLIVQDFINSAKKSGIPVGPGRGSVAGSLVAFTLGITEIDPLKYSLLFERFLNPERKSMPDIDVDFADDKRGEVIDYVRQKYGSNSVSQIITFNRLSSKAVIRDVARVLKIPIPTVNKITKWIPSKFGKVYTIDQALKEVSELRWVRDSKEPEIQNLIKYAKVLEGMNRNASKHAAGIVITPGEVSNYVPLANAVSQSDIVTQFNMKDLEYSGLLKMDFLGLRTLTIIRDTISLVFKNHGVKIDIDEIPLDDEKTYQLFWKGQTTGIFQFESAPMREYLKKLKPTSINDLSAMNALYRPGPMDFIDDFIDRKRGVKKVEYLHPILENILEETYGIIVYQEQVIQIANKVGGLSLAEADILRRAMGKKDLAAMKQQKEKFIAGAKANGISTKIAEEIFESIDKFANYGFNKSHSVAYSLVAYQTAYLKAYYTPEFLASNLKNEFGNTSKVTSFMEDCRKLKIPILQPDVNNPSVYFDVEKGTIKFGLSSIKNVGVNAVEDIIRNKEKLNRNFESIFDFCQNVDTRIINKRCVESLILAGAFDSINKERARLYAIVEDALSLANKVKNSKLTVGNSLFGGMEDDFKTVEPELPACKPWTQKYQLAKEREVIGFYMSEHPLRKYEIDYKSFTTIHLGETEQLENLDIVRVGGVITGLKTKMDKSGKNMAFFTLDDFTGSCEAIMFSKTYDKFQKLIGEEECIFIVGKPESSGDSIKLQIEEAYSPNDIREKLTRSIKVYIDPEKHNLETISSLKNIFQSNSGSIPVYIHLSSGNNGDSPHIYFLKNLRVKISDELINSITKLIGEDSILFDFK
ncbi:MAG: DNA polymerase III subunit alpha [Ignavibacteria bacterium RIFOXYB2_FULL_35_12]|nr:MAG: DNA polymerase III subunit alpha [Ignavibacteria bacterium GWA2_36_19]OGU61434.1 MAG: DNA polymerase III subunit alpha [Ignavibacteria bacterium GWF2_35_20]OGU78834.1 MAG: DNA polymerase III subunit alpha [Ignavibacteria bacterium RIFOXYA2_FULL_35_9]OGU85467.1 MAG: DNA polymerase III subunit alpha [Ignavibacteria bacterium RIFOXYA12_FULL_35_25]OGU90235.1 MAG: DNA polymerase III subunit alpha [Ignavibacteria bacterium RIFOXYC12_FULL_35_11]OGU96671.1 MAG: DNA polymerase III subunit alpha